LTLLRNICFRTPTNMPQYNNFDSTNDLIVLGLDSIVHSRNSRNSNFTQWEYGKMYENMKALKIRPETIPVSSFEMQMEVRFESKKCLLKSVNYSWFNSKYNDFLTHFSLNFRSVVLCVTIYFFYENDEKEKSADIKTTYWKVNYKEESLPV